MEGSVQRPAGTVTRRTFWTALVIVALLAAAGGLGLSALVLGKSREGRAGPPGPTGARGPAGATGPAGRPGPAGKSPALNSAAIVRAIQSDPSAVAAAIQPHLTPNPQTLCTDLKRVPLAVARRTALLSQ